LEVFLGSLAIEQTSVDPSWNSSGWNATGLHHSMMVMVVEHVEANDRGVEDTATMMHG